MGGGGIFSFSYMDDSKIPAAFEKKKKREERTPLKQKFHRKLGARFQIYMTGTGMTASTQNCTMKSRTHTLKKQQSDKKINTSGEKLWGKNTAT